MRNISIIRGPYLNAQEMQNFQPMVNRHTVRAFHSNVNHYDPETVPLPRVQLRSPEGLIGRWAYWWFRVPWHFPFGFYHYMLGLRESLAGSEIIHTAETFWGFSAQAALSAEDLHAKCVVTQWENIPGAHQHLPALRLHKQIVRKRAHRFIVPSNDARAALRKEGVADERISTVPMGVNIEAFGTKESPANARRALGLEVPDNAFVVTYAGRLATQKGIHDLVQGFAQARAADPGFRAQAILALVGDGPARSSLTRLARSLGVSDGLRFVTVDYDKMPLVYAASDLLVLLSHTTRSWREQFGMVLVEALASGVPVLGTRSGAIPEVLGDAARLVDEKSPDQVCAELLTLAGDPKSRAALAAAGVERARARYNCQDVARNLEDVYEAVLDGT